MLTADPHHRAPEIAISLKVSGTFRIFIGSTTSFNFTCTSTVPIRMSCMKSRQ